MYFFFIKTIFRTKQRQLCTLCLQICKGCWLKLMRKLHVYAVYYFALLFPYIQMQNPVCMMDSMRSYACGQNWPYLRHQC